MVKTIKINDNVAQQLDDLKGSKTYNQIIEEILWINKELKRSNQQIEELVKTFNNTITLLVDGQKNITSNNIKTYQVSFRSFQQIIQQVTNNDGYRSTIFYNNNDGIWVETLQELIEHPRFSNPKKQQIYIKFIKQLIEFMGEFEEWSQGARVNSSYMNDYGHIVTRLE